MRKIRINVTRKRTITYFLSHEFLETIETDGAKGNTNVTGLDVRSSTGKVFERRQIQREKRYVKVWRNLEHKQKVKVFQRHNKMNGDVH